MKIWARIIKNNKTISEFTIDRDIKTAFEMEDWNDPIGELCKSLNLSRPIILKKHINELETFNHTSFRAGDFIEKIEFDRLEIELF